MGKIGDIRLFPTDTNTIAPSSSFSNQTPIGAGPTNLNLPMSTLAGNVERDWLGKVSGFPESFSSDIRNLYRQMFRCYAHLYHSHWVEPFWHLGATKELNTCFLHFINVGKLFELLEEKDIVPMQPLVDIWAAKGLLPVKDEDGQRMQTGSAPTYGRQQGAVAAPVAG